MMSVAIAKTCGPGRPKDLEKRAAILEAAKRLFTTQGFDGTSMDAIAAAAGVSKLTVYSHFQDKERLFTAAVECDCEEQLPAELFLADLKGPIRKQLMTIAAAFFALVTSEEAIADASHHRSQRPAVAEARPAVLGGGSEARPGSVRERSCARKSPPASSTSPTCNGRRCSSSACSRARCHARREFGCGEPFTSARSRRSPQRHRRHVHARLRDALRNRALDHELHHESTKDAKKSQRRKGAFARHRATGSVLD